MNNETVLLESTANGVSCVERDGAHYILLCRPRKGNALSAGMVNDISLAFDRCLVAGARLIVLEGEGKHFCTGFDLSTLDSETDGDLLLRFVQIEMLLQKLHSSPVMTAAIGRGRTFGAGADLFASCDHRIAVRGASFAFPGSAFGLVLGTARLAGRIGRDSARMCLLAGTVLTDEAAFSQHLATDLVEDGNIPERLSTLTFTAHRLDSRTVRTLHNATDSANYDRELVDLVQSASVPGLRDRIAAYRDGLRSG